MNLYCGLVLQERLLESLDTDWWSVYNYLQENIWVLVPSSEWHCREAGTVDYLQKKRLDRMGGWVVFLGLAGNGKIFLSGDNICCFF